MRAAGRPWLRPVWTCKRTRHMSGAVDMQMPLQLKCCFCWLPRHGYPGPMSAVRQLTTTHTCVLSPESSRTGKAAAVRRLARPATSCWKNRATCGPKQERGNQPALLLQATAQVRPGCRVGHTEDPSQLLFPLAAAHLLCLSACGHCCHDTTRPHPPPLSGGPPVAPWCRRCGCPRPASSAAAGQVMWQSRVGLRGRPVTHSSCT